jgi:hypothetical protein
MKTKIGGIVVGMLLLLAFLNVTATASVKAHKITINGLVVDSITPGTDNNTIIGHKNGITYTVIASNKTKITRKNGTRISISRVYELNSLTIKGATLDGTTINAKKIRNNSLVKALRVGTIAYIYEGDLVGGLIGSFMMQAGDGTTKEVLAYGNTKVYNGKHRINYSNLQLGDIISAQGFVDTSFTLMDIVDDTSKIKIRGHGAVPNLFPSTLNQRFEFGK